MMQVIYRTITYDDIEEAYALESAVFSEPWPKSAFEEIVENKDADYYVAEDADTGKLLGGCVIFRILDEGDITNVAVWPEYRRQGVAEGLLKFALDHAQKLGNDEFTLEVRASNEAAIRLYEKCGFASEGIRPGFYSKPKEDAVIMWKRRGQC